jgi:PBP1b-binding outer membrane lipoprotein LpoB
MRTIRLLSRLIGSGTILAAALWLAGCGDEAAGPAAASATSSQTLDTAQVLNLAQAPSETTDPLPVDAGALVVADANDETADPIPVG